MAMPMAYCVPGAEVVKVKDFVRDAKGDATFDMVGPSGSEFRQYKFKPCAPQRGFIVKTKYPGDETFSSDAVEYVEVKFEKGKPAEKCVPSQLNLVKVANEAALMALKQDVQIQRGNEALVQDLRNGVVDKTGVGKTKSGKGLSKLEVEDLDKE